MALSPGTRIGAYEITIAIGAGGMGEVYRARDTRLDRDVALKILPESFASDPDRMMRFEREAKTLASLNHPHIAQIYGLEERALVMELVDGEDLSARINRGAIPLDEALPIAKQIAEALEAAHEQGIIHRDLKPANVKVRDDGTVKVLDFGLAKAMDPGAGNREPGTGNALANSPTITSPAMTMQGVILGTAAYMSPEQAKGKPVDKRSDIWSFGAVLYEMLSGQRAFRGEDVSELLVAVLSKEVDLAALPPGTPRSIVTLIRSCLERDPKNRRRDIGDARLELQAALADRENATREDSIAGPRNDLNRWKRVSVALAVSLAVLVVGSSVRFAYSTAEPVVDPPVMRFTLVDDPNMEIRFSTQPFAASPDGKTIVFSAAAGMTGLWVRTLDQPTARFLAGSEGGLQPAISPDGQWVAFVVANHIIRKIRLSGGASTTVASIDDVTASIAWASDDEILFEKIGSASSIHRVSANGGEPQPLLPLAGDEQGQYVPVVIREARLVFYASTKSDDREAAGVPLRGALDSGGTTLSTVSLVDGRRNALGLDGFRVLGLVDGQLVYARSDGALMAVPFDTPSLRAVGQPRVLEPKVSPGRFGPSVTMSESGTLVSLPAVSPLSRLMLADVQGRAVSIGEARAFESPRFSADGNRIAVGIAEGDGLDLWTLDRSTAAATRVTRGGPRSMKLESWMPDGHSLVHTRADGLWTVPVNGSEEPHKLFDVGGRLLGASVIAGGHSVVVLRRVRLGSGSLDREELVRVPTGGDHQAVPIYASRSSGGVLRGLDPRASPDGRFVALYDRNDHQVHIRSIEGDAGLQVSDTGGSLPVWGHDSRSLYYRTAAGTVRAELRTSPVLAVVARQLVPGIPTAGTLHDVSSDGKTYLILAPVDPAPKVLVTVNWAADVRRQLGGRRETNR
jgi:serine/threonine protein kinase/Tol biopolymer transport system component